MKIKNLNIYNSNVTIAEKIENSKNNFNWGINEHEFIKLTETIKQNETSIKNFVNQNFDKSDIIEITPEKQNKFIAGLKQFGFDFGTSLTSSGIVELLKYFLLPI